MQICDRYKTDSSEERQRYEERLAKSRRGIREDYDLAEKIAVGLFILFFGFVLLFGLWADRMPAALIAVLASAAILTLVAAFIGYYIVQYKIGDDEQPDLYIYGMENGDFLLLNPLYEELDRISPGDVREIRILAAMRPTTRQRCLHRHGNGFNPRYGETTHYEYYGETTGNDGWDGTTPYPMAVLCTCEKDFDWRWIDDPIFRRDLQKWVTFVPLGDNASNFMHLLKNTACPVVIVQEIYDTYWQNLDALFTQSGMDLNRLQIMQEESRRAQATRII